MDTSHLQLNPSNWDYGAYFDEPHLPHREVVDRVEQYVIDRHLESHTFFDLAISRPDALMIWLSQELVMTNTFSQVVLYAASRIENVHIRAALADVAYGEHGRARNGRASKAHPVLLDKLRSSVGLAREDMKPLPPTVEFVEKLCAATERPLTAVAAIGVGNERLIFPEYEAVWKCFDVLFPDSEFAPFLDANLKEDKTHSALCVLAALELMDTEEDEIEYERAAIASVEARWTYFDGLEEITTSRT